MKKNLTPQALSAIISLLIALASSLFIIIFKTHPLGIPIAFLLVFILSYLLIIATIQKFIYRKIKLIYKMINHTKASKREEFYYKNLLPPKSIEEVSEEVEAWSRQYSADLEALQKNETFRKEFLQNLSHELKTPIFAVQGYVDTLLGGALHNEAVNTKFLQNAAKNIDRLVKLVDDLDEISKLEIGEPVLNRKSFIIQDLIKEVFEERELATQEKKILCMIKKGCETPVSVYADKEKIRQVLVNLTDNAVKYGKENGSVIAGVYTLDENNVLIEISDDGSGIAEEHLPRIFERFYRTDLARSRRVGGSGLGLAICKHIIEAHGSSIHVRSTPNVGSTFGFTLKRKGGS